MRVTECKTKIVWDPGTPLYIRRMNWWEGYATCPECGKNLVYLSARIRVIGGVRCPVVRCQCNECLKVYRLNFSGEQAKGIPRGKYKAGAYEFPAMVD